jgi:pumilio RNA-binding family
MTVPPERLSFLRVFRDAARQLAIHPYGCRVLQRCLEYLPNDYCRGMIDELHGIAESLMQDQFGVSVNLYYPMLVTYTMATQNYVVQYVLQHGQPHDCVIIAAQMKGNVLKMSRHKFASNVVEKVLVHANSETRSKLVDEILTTEHGVDPVHALMMDAYGSKLYKFLTLCCCSVLIQTMSSKLLLIRSAVNRESCFTPV